jgi:hypothetical protein
VGRIHVGGGQLSMAVQRNILATKWTNRRQFHFLGMILIQWLGGRKGGGVKLISYAFKTYFCMKDLSAEKIVVLDLDDSSGAEPEDSKGSGKRELLNWKETVGSSNQGQGPYWQ